MSSRDCDLLNAWHEDASGPDYEARLTKLLLAIGDWLKHEAEYPTLASGRVNDIRALYEEYGGKELSSKKFWEFVKETSAKVREKRNPFK